MTLLFAGQVPFQGVWAAPAGGSSRPQSGLRKAALQARHQKIIHRLNLTTDQRQRIQAFKADHRKSMAEINAKIHVARVELENEMDKPKSDPAQVKILTEEIGRLKAARELENLKAKREIEKILTPEQNAELKRIQQENPAQDAVTAVDPPGE